MGPRLNDNLPVLDPSWDEPVTGLWFSDGRIEGFTTGTLLDSVEVPESEDE